MELRWREQDGGRSSDARIARAQRATRATRSRTWTRRARSRCGRPCPEQRRQIESPRAFRVPLGDGVALEIVTARPAGELAHNESRRLEVGALKRA
ncbi:hypothetical protein NDU88_003045 [Pleurodeles waltl]|uniref:Uncharacterized protein n=1 Tax=Pleurodeles waltl TaxID=8319 RepID=A0AAV7M490_PLEWA|nr:hypothetical protein NDU88_003045 [Pleurodeles waltl]